VGTVRFSRDLILDLKVGLLSTDSIMSVFLSFSIIFALCRCRRARVQVQIFCIVRITSGRLANTVEMGKHTIRGERNLCIT
jgi:hypothetical protein